VAADSVVVERRAVGEMGPAMRLRRTLRHLLTPAWHHARAFPRRTLAAIDKAIAESTLQHEGKLCFAVEHALDVRLLLRGMSARERAVEVFAERWVWDTEGNNGVLIYLLLADRDVEIVADRGFHDRVGPADWEAICRRMEAAFQRGEFEAGVLEGIHAVRDLLRTHFPRGPQTRT
jgi:uncharacterized membrane protein